MEQIIVTRPDNTTYTLANRQTATSIKSAKQSWELLNRDVVNITVGSPYPQTYGIGDKITVFGRTYKLHRLPKVKKAGAHSFSYDLEFEGVQYDLMRATFNLSIDTTSNEIQDVQADALTGDLSRFATVLIANANRVFTGVWILGSCPATDGDKTLTFGESDNCLSVLQQLCSEFNVEYEISQTAGVNTINFVEKVGQLFPHTFRFGRGKGLYQLDRQNVDSSNIVTRLYVYGSTANITNKYRANRLCLPGKNKGQSYIEKQEAVDKFGIYEATKYFEDIKPTFNGAISAIVTGNVLQFIDANMFDLNALEADEQTHKYMLPGVKPKIHINSGNLAGYQFEIHEYDHDTHTFTVVQQDDERGELFPSERSQAFQFGVGDKYKILDVALPAEYETAAETKLAEQGDTYYDQNSQPKVQYSLSITKEYLEGFSGEGATVNIFAPGDFIPVQDEDIEVDKAVRVKSLVRNLLDEYEYSLTISDTVSASITNRVISELIEHDKVIAINNLKDPARARANWRSSREILAMTFDPEGNYYTEKIRPESIDTVALSVGAKSMQFALANTIIEPNYTGDKNKIRVTGGIITHYTISEDSAIYWNIANSEVVFENDSQAYYIYVKCERSGPGASIIFSTEQIKVDQDSSFYHFWIGVINSVDAEMQVRSIALSYGFTTINGRFIKTGRIQSPDGAAYFDLDSGIISGKIRFLSGGVETDLEGWANQAGSAITDAQQALIANAELIEDAETAIGEAQQAISGVQAELSDTQTAIDNLDTYVDGSFHDGIIEEAEAKAIEKYLNQLNAQGGELDSMYNKLYANPLLAGTPKTNIETAKNNFFGDLTTLISTIQAAIADGKVTAAEKADVDSKFSQYRTSLSTFSTRIEEANQAVQQAIKLIADDAQGTANVAKAITDKFGTTVDGGLISTVMMLLRDLNNPTETAGMSGIRGANMDNPAFWTGGTYSQAVALINFLLKMSEGTAPAAGEYNNLAKVTLLHNGAAKVGDFIIESNGRIVMVDPATGKERLVFNTSDIPTISSLISGITDDGYKSILGDSVNHVENSRTLGSFQITSDNTRLTFSGATLNINATSSAISSATATLRLIRNGALYQNLGSVGVSFGTTGMWVDKSNTQIIPQFSLNGCPAGNYSLQFIISEIGGVQSMDANTSPSMSFSWEFTQAGVRYFQYGLNGMMAFYSNEHFHFTEGNGLDVRGATNMPGGLASGSSSAAGVHANIWGAKASTAGVTPITGGFRVPLKDMEHSNYTVQITPHTSTTFRIGTKTSTYFEVYGTGGFDYVVFGNNYA